jgi:tRNA pseudouridine38-40 synthase
MLRVVRMTLAYEGTGFRGWAAQRDPLVRTVEGVVGAALADVVREAVVLSVAGRTDAGVHARGQVISFVTSSGVAPRRMLRAVNGALGPEVVVREAAYAPEGFDARFSASAREYRYVIDTALVPDPFSARFVWNRAGDLSVPRMRSAARPLLGEHDFVAFCRHPGAGRATVRRLQRLSIQREGDLVVFGLRANAFLHQMVRSLVGMLVAVGDGRIEPEALLKILEARDRSRAKHIVPARGLTLERVVYGKRRPGSETASSRSRA